MHAGRSLPVLLLVFIALLAGCGGGGESGGSQEGGSQEGGSQNGGSQNGGGQQQGDSGAQAPESRIALGTVARVNPDNERRIVVSPSANAQEQRDGGERLIFKIRKNANVRLGGQPAEIGDISQGQQAQIEYVVKNDLNRATSVTLFRTEGQPSGGEETSN